MSLSPPPEEEEKEENFPLNHHIAGRKQGKQERKTSKVGVEGGRGKKDRWWWDLHSHSSWEERGKEKKRKGNITNCRKSEKGKSGPPKTIRRGGEEEENSSSPLPRLLAHHTTRSPTRPDSRHGKFVTVLTSVKLLGATQVYNLAFYCNTCQLCFFSAT